VGVIGTIVETAAKKVLINSAKDAAITVAAGTVDAITKIHENAPQKGNHICTLRDADEFSQLSVQEAQEELEACGFTNIGFVAQKAFLKRDGQVLAVTIDGRTAFTKETRFKNDVRVVIAYKGK